MLKNGNKGYIIFLATVIPIFFMFITSNIWLGTFSRESNTYNYQVTASLNNYYIKADNATYNTDTKEFAFTLYTKQHIDSNAEYPSIYSVAVDYDIQTFCDYNIADDVSNEYGQQVTVKNINDDFKYVRIFLQSKSADEVVPESIDDFGNVTPEQIVEGEINYLKIIVDVSDTTIISNDSAPITTNATSAIFDENNVVTGELDNDIPTAVIVDSTTIPATTVPPTTTKTPATTTAPTTSKEPVTTTAKQNTTSKATTKVTTTTSKITAKTTTKASTTNKESVIHITSLSLKTVSQSNTVMLNVGDTTTVTPVILPNNATNKKVDFASNRTDLATVDSNGLVKAVGKGTVIIVCHSEDGELEASCMIIIG